MLLISRSSLSRRANSHKRFVLFMPTHFWSRTNLASGVRVRWAPYRGGTSPIDLRTWAVELVDDDGVAHVLHEDIFIVEIACNT